MNINSIRRTRAVQAILDDIAKCLKARAGAPQEIVVTRKVHAQLRETAGDQSLDYNGIPVVCR